MAHEIWETDKMAFRLSSGLPWHYAETGADGRAVGIDHEGPISAGIMMEMSGLHWTVSLEHSYVYVTAPLNHWHEVLARELTTVTEEDEDGEACTYYRNEDDVEKAKAVLLSQSVETKENGDITLLRKIPRQFAVVRSDTLEPLGVVGHRYTPLQNREAFQLLEAIMGEGNLDYETAGSLMGGRKVWILAKFPEDMFPTDFIQMERYILLATSHDGSSSIRIRFTSVNVVCNNTLTAALGESDRAEFSVRHTHSATKENIVENAKNVLGVAAAAFDQLAADAARLVNVKFTEEDASAFFRVLIAPDAEEDDDVSTRSKNVMEFLEWAYRSSPGNEDPRVAGTAWAALQAVTYYTTHAITSRVSETRKKRSEAENVLDEAHLDSVLFGSSERLGRRAKTILLHMADEREKESGLVS
jgi:phage/plasmid-like protein (TIGR03299 family)